MVRYQLITLAVLVGLLLVLATMSYGSAAAAPAPTSSGVPAPAGVSSAWWAQVQAGIHPSQRQSTGTGNLLAVFNWGAQGDQADARFGVSVATAGDVNGDGYDDGIVGAYLYDNGEEDEGRAYVYHGSASGLSVSSNWTAESDQAAEFWSCTCFGASVGTAGDVNGDGYSDALVGASNYDNGQENEGRAYLYVGSPQGLVPGPTGTVEANQSEAHLGLSVGTAGDVNGDDLADIILGAYFYDRGQTDEGVAVVFHGRAP